MTSPALKSLVIVTAILAGPSSAFVVSNVLPASFPATTTRATTSLSAITVSEVPAEGDRSIIDGPDGAIIITKAAGSYYAVDAKCPHLGLPMKKGKIESGPDGVPEITCNFHNSCFNMQTGACTKWVTGALGMESGLISGIMGKVGSDQSDVKAYTVTENEDGTLSIE